MSPSKTPAEILNIDGTEVRISSPDKVVFPEPGLTKLDLVRYYLAVAEGALRGAGGRPMVLKRFPKGIDAEPFFQKRVPENHPDFIDTATLHYASGTSAEEAVIRDAAGLAWVVNLGCLDLNPHPVRAEDLEHPDELRVDLDPMPGVDWSQIVDVAYVARDVLDDVGTRRLAEDQRVARPAHPGAHRAAVVIPRRAARRRDPRPRGRKPRAGPRHRAVVEGGARRERVRRLQPEREGPHRGIRLLDPAAARRPGLDAARLGRGALRAPEQFTVRTVPRRFADDRRPARRHRRRGRLLDGLLALAAELGPAEKPPRGGDGSGRRQSMMPLIEVARTRTKPEALAALDEWKTRHADVVPALHPADVLVDGMRGSSSLWYRVRVNLQHVPEAERPPQDELIADYDPWAGREWPGRPGS